MSEITVGMHVDLDPDGNYGLFEDGGHAPYGGTIEQVYDDGEVLVRFHDGDGWVEWSMPASVVRPVVSAARQVVRDGLRLATLVGHDAAVFEDGPIMDWRSLWDDLYDAKLIVQASDPSGEMWPAITETGRQRLRDALSAASDDERPIPAETPIQQSDWPTAGTKEDEK